MEITRKFFSLGDRWCVHSYYTLNPYAPDGSGRILASGCNPDTGIGEVLVLDADGHILDTFGRQRISASFYHTGFWQAWGPDSNTVYYSASDGDVLHPRVAMRDLITGRERVCNGDMEGAPAFGEPIAYGLHAMMYAAGYGSADGRYQAELSPVPFAQRDRHGLFLVSPSAGTNELVLSVRDAMQYLPEKDRLAAEDARLRKELGGENGLTMMISCVRYSRDGRRLMFHLGNHCVDKRRGEPRIRYMFTANADLSDIRMVMDHSFGHRGVHWSWEPDGEHLMGYTSRADDPEQLCLAEIRCDGTGFRVLSMHDSGGHSSMCPATRGLIVTDEWDDQCGRIVFLDGETGDALRKIPLPKYNFELGTIPPGRNRYRICHHAVFSDDGRHILANCMEGRNSTLTEFTLSGELPGEAAKTAKSAAE